MCNNVSVANHRTYFLQGNESSCMRKCRVNEKLIKGNCMLGYRNNFLMKILIKNMQITQERFSYEIVHNE